MSSANQRSEDIAEAYRRVRGYLNHGGITDPWDTRSRYLSDKSRHRRNICISLRLGVKQRPILRRPLALSLALQANHASICGIRFKIDPALSQQIDVVWKAEYATSLASWCSDKTEESYPHDRNAPETIRYLVEIKCEFFTRHTQCAF